MNQIMEGEPLTIFGDGTRTRSFTYIKEAAHLIARSIYAEEAYNQIFDMGADEPFSVNELARKVSNAMGVAHKVRHVEEREEVKEAYCSHEKMNNVLNFIAKYKLPEGLRLMADRAKRHG